MGRKKNKNKKNKKAEIQLNSKGENHDHDVKMNVTNKDQKTSAKEPDVEITSVEETKVNNNDDDGKGKEGLEQDKENIQHYDNCNRKDRATRSSSNTNRNKIPRTRTNEEKDIIQSMYDEILHQLNLPVRSIDSLPGPPIAPYVYGEGAVITLKWEVPYMSAEESPIMGYIIEVREGNQWSPIHEDIWEPTSRSIDIQKYNNCVFRIYAVNQIGKGKTCLEQLVSYKGKYIQGLPNVGNTCYANSVFQVLAQTPNLTNHLLDIMTHTNINRNQSFIGILWKLLMGINREPSFSDQNAIRSNIQRLINKICTSDGSFHIMEQNDSHSFMMTLFNEIKDEVTTQGYENGVLSIFELLMVTKYWYDPCGHDEIAEEQMFTSLLIPIDNYSAGMELHDGVKILTESEDFPDNTLPCPFCESPPNTVATKTSEVVKFPEILILQLGKFIEMGGHIQKLDTRVTYDKTFVLQRESDACTQKYTLYGLTLHSGSIAGGHYYAYVKYQNKEDGSEQWYICNDSFVTETNLRYILQDRGVSMLFYHKTEM